jgi:hypothetical protein
MTRHSPPKRMTKSQFQTFTSKYWYVMVLLVLSLMVMMRPDLHLTPVIATFGASNRKTLKLATWNIAAINNNPFEYWITSPDPEYNELMKKVSAFILNPQGADVPISAVFTQEMFDELIRSITDAGLSNTEETKSYWEQNFKNRKIISEFIKDGLIGKKRLASMPDRVTNTITTADGKIVMRPTVINCYAGALDDVASWWAQWKSFMFNEALMTKKKDGTMGVTKVHQMLSKISRSKYPSVTETEEQMSLPLQIVSLAIFDAILVKMMLQVSVNPKSWQSMRSTMCRDLNSHKNDRILEILQTTYSSSDIIFLQEVAGQFPRLVANTPLVETYFDLVGSSLMDSDRDQNSFVLLRKQRYINVREVTEEVNKILASQSEAAKTKVPVVKGDLLVLVADDALDGTSYILASFHGDTNGLATKPVVEAVYTFATTQQPSSKLLFGMDANTYTKPEADQYSVTDFAKFYTSKQLNSCYGPTPNPFNFTTFHARTHLQPQLNKAIAYEEKDTKGDKNPKDFIVFFGEDYRVLQTTKDNTGEKKYIENMVFPTLSFPSDHGITSTVLDEVKLQLRSGSTK